MTAATAPTPVPCLRCDRMLVDPKSIALGVGPTCFRRLVAAARATRAAAPAADQITLRVCSTCGCHDLARCTRGCGWVEPNLCSTCAGGEVADG